MLYAVPNLATAIAYFYIGSGIKSSRQMRQTEVENYLFKLFILLCGLHHLSHPVFMYYDIFWPMISVDVLMAYISVLAAIKVRL